MAANAGALGPEAGAGTSPGRGGRGGLLGFARSLRGNPKALAGASILAAFALIAILAPVIAPVDPSAQRFAASRPPSAAHLLGTTSYGQDIFAQLVWGTRESLLLAIVAGLVASGVSVIVGVAAAYLGGLADGVLSVLTDVFLIIPALPLMIVIAAYAKSGGIVVLVAVIVVTSWAYGARVMRSQALSLRNREFLEAARVRGERGIYIIVVEILPTMASLIAAHFLNAALFAVLAAAGLQFIGLGDPHSVSWGTMLYWAENNQALMVGSPLWALAPGLCIGLLGGAFGLLNYGFDELANPALRPVRRRRGRPAA